MHAVPMISYQQQDMRERTHTHTVGSKCQAVPRGIKVNEDQ